MAIAAAANPIPTASCVVGRSVLYGSRNSLIRWDVDSNDVAIVGSLEGRIECITAAPNQQVVWIGTNSGKIYKYESSRMSLYETLPKSITCIACNNSLLAIGCMDGNVYVYSSLSAPPSTPQIISVKGYALCVALCENLLVIGGTAWKIFVHDLNATTNMNIITLEGHENWVRSLSFRKSEEEEGTYLLASASQERYIRLWKFTTKTVKFTEFSTNHKIGDWTISFEALLMGHDDWVLTVEWDPYGSNSLLSASSDSSLIVWKAEDSDLWTPDTRLGDVSQWGASTATGTSGGFWTGLWLTDRVITTTITGSWRVWMRPTESESEWKTVPGLTGHLKDVTDIAWLAHNLALSTSLDQTTRLWYYDQEQIWEIGRPQIHGYDMMAVAPINSQLFVSAGDEKVMRVFELPKQVAQQIEELTGTAAATTNNVDELPDTAAVPVLGLSNKSEHEDLGKLPIHPREDHLQRLTLWPEADKLYGHGYEVCAIASSPQLGVVVSCCKANSEQHAKLRFYDTKTWLEVPGPTAGHSLTVTSLQVSPDGKRVLSVGRDRKFMLTDIANHEVLVDFPKAHTRIIWDCCFVNDDEFLTVSRDKTVKLWSSDQLKATHKLEAAGTAVDYHEKYAAIGEETGKVTVFKLDDTHFIEIGTFSVPGRVNRVRFSGNLLAVASDMVSIFEYAPRK